MADTTTPTTARTTTSAQQYNDRNAELFRDRSALKARIAELEAAIAAAEAAGASAAAERRELRRVNRRFDDITREIVEFNFGLVRSYVKKFTSNTSREDSRDFEAAAVVGLMRAIDNYDPAQGRFGQWAFKPIQREVLRAVRDCEYQNMNPGDFERRPDILRAVAELQNGDPNFKPSHAEVAAVAGVTVEQVARVLDAPHLDSLSTPVGADGEGTLGDLIEASGPSLEDSVISHLSVEALETHGLTALDPRELFVIVRRYGLDCEPPQRLSAIGEMLGLSREAVRQIEAKAIAKISHPVILRRLVRHGRK